MRRDQLARAALRAYPEAVRRTRGPEMIDTLLDASDGSMRAFARELFALLRAGVRSRACATADAGFRRLAADGVCLGATLWIGVRISEPVGFQPTRWQFWLLAAALALALAGCDRLAGLVVFAWIALVNPVTPFGGQDHTLGWSFVAVQEAQLLALGSFAIVMLIAPRRRPRSLRRLLWLAMVAALAYGATLGTGAIAVATIAVSLASLCVPAAIPRLAIATALWWTWIGIEQAFVLGRVMSPLSIALAAGPIVLALSAARVRRLQRQSVA